MDRLFTTREIADILGTQMWRVRRLFQDGTLPEPSRFGGRRAISSSMIPSIVDQLRQRGWLPDAAGELVAAEATP